MTQIKTNPLVAACSNNVSALAAVFTMSFFANLSMLALPLYSMQLYDRVLSSESENTLFFLTLIAAMFLLVFGVLDYVRAGILARAGIRFEDTLNNPLFDRLFRTDSVRSSSDAQQYLRDAQTMRSTISGGTVSTLFDLPWTPLFVVLCFGLHSVLGCIALVGVLLLVGLAVANELLTGQKIAHSLAQAGAANAFVGSTFRGREAAIALGMGGALRDHWNRMQGAAQDANAISIERAASIQAATKSIRYLIQIALLCAGAWLVIQREVSPGVMLASSIIMGRALQPVEQIVAHWKGIVAFRNSYARVRAIFDKLDVPHDRTALPAPKGSISVENVAVCAMPGIQPTVMGVSFQLEAGDTLAIVGASGSGKSTFAKSLVGARPIFSGTIRMDGAAYDQWGGDDLGQHIGYVPQDIELFAGTVAVNIARMTKGKSEDIIAAAKEACVHEAILKMPNGYETFIGPAGEGLSGGMRQRVALARALYGNPKLVVMDEPNSNLDEDGEQAFARSVEKMKAANRTVVVVTHRPQILRHLNKLLVMGLGRQIAFGDREEVMGRMRGNKVAAL